MDRIFVSVASYRDKLCTKTLESIFTMAEHPERVIVGICQQNKEDDSDCANFESEVLKRYKNNIRVIKIDYIDAQGPCVARYWCSTLWNGEEYFLQADSHILMSDKWDTKAINMLKEIKHTTKSQKPILSHYTKPYEEFGLENPTNTVPRMCKAFFNERGMISFLGAENISISKNTYIETPYIAAGFLFVESQFLKEVPFDPYLPYLFVGEEILLSIRAWTSGYDIYTPSEDLMFHLYTRKDDNKIWTDQTYTDEDAFNKVKMLIKLDDISKPIPNMLLNNIQRYGLGKVRTIDEYYDFAGIDIKNKKVNKDFCKNTNTNTNTTNFSIKSTIIYYFWNLLNIFVIIILLTIVGILIYSKIQ